jgi:hypothetical protein
MARRRNINVPVSPVMQRAAELRGVPLTQWVQSVLHTAAWRDFVEARTILEEAGFADKVGRLRRERALREQTTPRDPAVKLHREKMARIIIVPSNGDDPPSAA